MTQPPEGATPVSMELIVQAVGELYLQNYVLRRSLEAQQAQRNGVDHSSELIPDAHA